MLIDKQFDTRSLIRIYIKGYRRLLHKIDNSGGRPFTRERTILKKRYHKNTNTITISAMAFLMLLLRSSSVSTAGEASKLKLDYSLTDEQSMKRTKSYTDVIIGHDGQQRERFISYFCICISLVLCAHVLLKLWRTQTQIGSASCVV